MRRNQFLRLLSSSLVLAGCRPPSPTKWELFSPNHLARWTEAELFQSGGFEKGPDGLHLNAGKPMSGTVYKSWVADGLPLSNYRIDYEAMRVSGGDFFGTLTFPVERIDQCLSFVFGGWGGYQVGISSIDGLDASQNETGSSQPLENNIWYQLRIEVRDGLLQVWMNQRPLVRLNTSGRQLHLRSGDIDKCAPFGFATYLTEARIRNCVISRIA